MESRTTEQAALSLEVQMKNRAPSKEESWDMNDFNTHFDFDDMLADIDISQVQFDDLPMGQDFDFDDMLTNVDISQVQFDDLPPNQDDLHSCRPQKPAAMQTDNSFGFLPTAKSDNLLLTQEKPNTYFPQDLVAAQTRDENLYQASLATSSSWQRPAPVDPTLGIANSPVVAQTVNDGFHWNTLPATTSSVDISAQPNFLHGEPQDSVQDAMPAVLWDPQFLHQEDLAADPNAVPSSALATENGFDSGTWSAKGTPNRVVARGDWVWVPHRDYPDPPGLEERLSLTQIPGTSQANDIPGPIFDAGSTQSLQTPSHAGNQRPRYPYIPPPARPQHPQHPLSQWRRPASQSPLPSTMTRPIRYPSRTQAFAAPAHNFNPHDMHESREYQGMLHYARPCHPVPASFSFDGSDTEDNHTLQKLQPCVCQCGNVHGKGGTAPRKPTGKKTLRPLRSVALSGGRKHYRVKKPRAKPPRTPRTPRNLARFRAQAEYELEEQNQREGKSPNFKTSRSAGLVAPAQNSKHHRNEKPCPQPHTQPPRTRAQLRMQAERERKENEKKETELNEEAEEAEDDEDDEDNEEDEDDDHDEDYEESGAPSRAPSQARPQPSMKVDGLDGVDNDGRPLAMAVKLPIRRSLNPGRHIQVEQTAAVMARNLKRRERYREQLPVDKRMEYDFNTAKAKGLV